MSYIVLFCLFLYLTLCLAYLHRIFDVYERISSQHDRLQEGSAVYIVRPNGHTGFLRDHMCVIGNTKLDTGNFLQKREGKAHLFQLTPLHDAPRNPDRNGNVWWMLFRWLRRTFLPKQRIPEASCKLVGWTHWDPSDADQLSELELIALEVFEHNNRDGTWSLNNGASVTRQFAEAICSLGSASPTPFFYWDIYGGPRLVALRVFDAPFYRQLSIDFAVMLLAPLFVPLQEAILRSAHRRHHEPSSKNEVSPSANDDELLSDRGLSPDAIFAPCGKHGSMTEWEIRRSVASLRCLGRDGAGRFRRLLMEGIRRRGYAARRRRLNIPIPPPEERKMLSNGTRRRKRIGK